MDIFKKASKASKPMLGEQIGRFLVNGYELRAPSDQNAVDLIEGWNTYFPPEFGVQAGHLDLSNDARLQWALERFGPIEGRRVLELGPLEAGHTFALDRRGAIVDAVEAGGAAYLKCLIAKEIFGLKTTRFHFGDCVAWLEDQQQTYDLIVASGILYHMVDPLRLLRAMSARSDRLYIWTMVIDEPPVPPTRVEPFAGVDVRLYLVPYGVRTKAFCGGANPDAMWIAKADLIAVLKALGYAQVDIAHVELNAHGPSLSLFASRAS